MSHVSKENSDSVPAYLRNIPNIVAGNSNGSGLGYAAQNAPSPSVPSYLSGSVALPTQSVNSNHVQNSTPSYASIPSQMPAASYASSHFSQQPLSPSTIPNYLNSLHITPQSTPIYGQTSKSEPHYQNAPTATPVAPTGPSYLRNLSISSIPMNINPIHPTTNYIAPHNQTHMVMPQTPSIPSYLASLQITQDKKQGNNAVRRLNAVGNTIVRSDANVRTVAYHPHRLRFYQSHNAWRCDSCLGIEQGDHFVCDEGCNIDFCTRCVASTSSIAISHPNHMHTLCLTNLYSNWSCNSCKMASRGSRYRCMSGCDYDLCYLCIIERYRVGMIPPIAFKEQTHPHPIRRSRKTDPWRCSRCDNSCGRQRYRCIEQCKNFNICEKCTVVEVLVEKKEEVPVAAVEVVAECIICFDELKNRYAFVPCGHANCCFECGKQLLRKRCPLCRTTVKAQVRLFL